MTDMEKIKAALEPFKFAAKFAVNDSDGFHVAYGIQARDLRRAAEAYAALEAAQGLIDKPVIEGGGVAWKMDARLNALLNLEPEIEHLLEQRNVGEYPNFSDRELEILREAVEAVKALSPALVKEGVVEK